jgi:DNA-binding response OmpR family regulator
MILLVEDEPLIRMVTAEMLCDAGFSVEEAGNAAEAMAKLNAARTSLEAIIIDIGLPDRPGDELAKEIRQLSADLPILIASGYDSGRIASLFLGDHRVSFVGKPYTGTVLVEALHAFGVDPAPSGGAA